MIVDIYTARLVNGETIPTVVFPDEYQDKSISGKKKQLIVDLNEKLGDIKVKAVKFLCRAELKTWQYNKNKSE